MGDETVRAVETIDQGLRDVQACMQESLGQSSLSILLPHFKGVLGSGKMLRARLAMRVGSTSDVAYGTLVNAAAAVEMCHTASLLHDDIIDNSMMRRGAPTFWSERGVPGAILLGDLMICKSVGLLAGAAGGRLAERLVTSLIEVCDAECEQELMLRGNEINWEKCLSVARRKTGALFAFAGYAAAGSDDGRAAALLEAGYLVGTAYQLADDIHDAWGNPEDSDKTLGTDGQRNKLTAATVDGQDPAAYVRDLFVRAEALLEPWPETLDGWRVYTGADVRPAVDVFLEKYPGR